MTLGLLFRLLEVECPAAARLRSLRGRCPWGPGSGLRVSCLGSIPLETAWVGSISGEPEVPRRMGEGGANNNSRSVLGLYISYMHWPIQSYNSPLRSVQVLIYQMRILRSDSWKVTDSGFEPTSTDSKTHTRNPHAANCSQVQSHRSASFLPHPLHPELSRSPALLISSFEICT